MRRHGAVSIVWLLILLFLAGSILTAVSSSADQPDALQVVRITPTGRDVPAGRQIVFQFNRAVVPVGRMAARFHNGLVEAMMAI